jgi:hypothetical protein
VYHAIDDPPQFLVMPPRAALFPLLTVAFAALRICHGRGL